MKMFIISLLLIATCKATVLTANFDALRSNTNTSLSSGYSEGGMSFTSSTGFNIVSGSFGATLFGWGGYTFIGAALSSNNTGWTGINTGGTLMSSAGLQYGFDWNGYMIEYGLMDVAVEWRTMLNGSMVSSGGYYFNREKRSHGGGSIYVSGLFDTFLVRSTAVLYQGIYTGGTGPGGWYYERGAIISSGPANRIAIDNVWVNTANESAALALRVSEHGSTLLLGSLAGLMMFGVRRFAII